MFRVLSKLLRGFAVLLPGLIGLFLIARAFVEGNTADLRYGLTLMGLLCLSLIVPLGGAAQSRVNPRSRLAVSLVLLAILAIYPFTVVVLIFGKIDMAAFVFHLVFGVGGTPWNDILPYMFTAAMLWISVLVSYFRLVPDVRASNMMTLVFALGIIAANPLVHDLAVNRASAMLGPARTVLQEFHEPVLIDAPQKPNLIIVYLEGFDRGYLDPERFGDIAAPLVRLEKRGVSFQSLRQVEATGWSLAGTVATQCGTPLLPFGAKPLSDTSTIQLILPDVTCLPDILTKRGYDVTYMSGAKISGNKMGFYGFDNFLSTHGNAAIEDRDTIKNARTANIAPEDWDDWGIFDSELLDGALTVIRTKAKTDRPYAVFIATMDTHGPAAMISPACTTDGKPQISNDMREAVRCISGLMERFVETLQAEFGPDLRIAVFSDHLNHSSNLTSLLEEKPRFNTAILLGPEREQKAIHRVGSMLDLFPTLLDWLGLLAPGEYRAGLGISLLAEQPTLVERLGFEDLNSILRVDTALSRHIWRNAEITTD